MESRLYAFDEHIAFVLATWGCNNRCSFCCLQGDRGKRRPPSEAEVRQFIEDAAAAGCPELDIAGGEVTLLPWLESAIAQAKGRFRRISVLSNGRRFADADYTRRLLDAGLTRVGVSLQASRADIHDELSGVDGAFDETVQGLRNVVASVKERARDGAPDGGGVGLWVSTAMHRRNLDDLVALGHLLREIGVEQWLLRFPTGHETVMPFGDAAPHVRAALEAHREALVITTKNVPLCVLDAHARHSSDLQEQTGLKIDDHGVVEANAAAPDSATLPPCRACAAARGCPGPEESYRERYGAKGLTPMDGARFEAVLREAEQLAEETRRRVAEQEGDPLGDAASRRDWAAVREAAGAILARLPDDERATRMRRMAEGHLLHDEAIRQGQAGNHATRERLLARVRSEYADVLGGG